ncbi:DNA polymerase III subunit delta [Nocardioidaceae bacterium]|nr:DNA polymerase III subunit delta [Nocardioidaceae bacterium]
MSEPRGSGRGRSRTPRRPLSEHCARLLSVAGTRAPSAADVLGTVTLLTGPEEFLGERAVTTLKEVVRGVDPEAEFSDTVGSSVTAAALDELSAPSLFSSTRCVVVRLLEDLPEEAVPGVVDYAAAPAEDVALILVHTGGQKGTGILTRLRKLDTVRESKSAAVKAHELPGFVAGEVRRHGGRIETPAAEALVQAVGTDLRALAGAADQLAHDFADRSISADLVARYFGGRAETKSFAVADAAVLGRAAVALEELRWALDTGTPPVLVTSALAGSLRALGRLQGVRRGARDADIARELGVPPWKVRQITGQARAWDAAGIATALRAVARADAEVKGAAHDPAYALERMLLDVTEARLG